MKLNNIDLNKLQVFHQIIKQGSLLKASERLNVSKSAVSQSLKSFEQQVGASLFLRKGKQLIPTGAAIRLFEEVDEYQKNIFVALSKINNQEQSIKGLIRVGAYLEFAKTQLIPVIKDFSDLYPEVNMKLLFNSPTKLKYLLETDQIDLSFSIFPIKNKKKIKSIKIYKEELVLICKKGERSKFKDYNSILNAHIIDYYQQDLVLTKWININFNKRLKKVPVKLFAASAEMVLSAVKQNIGIGVVPNYLVDNDVEVISVSDKSLTDYIWLNFFEDQFTNKAQKEFLSFVKNWFN